MEDVRLMLGDCLERMNEIDDRAVDLVLCDLPYGTTDCKWDSIIPLDRLWDALNRVCKINTAMIFTSAQPFTTILNASNLSNFKYEIVWDKVNRNTGYGNVSFMPLRRHENISIFVNAGRPTFNPQMTEGVPYVAKRSGKIPEVYGRGGLQVQNGKSNGARFPVSVLPIKADVKTEMGQHPTQKPVALMDYMIRTYTNAGAVVLDNCMGSGTTGVAALNCGRRFIGIERDPDYFAIAERRIKECDAYRLVHGGP